MQTHPGSRPRPSRHAACDPVECRRISSNFFEPLETRNGADRFREPHLPNPDAPVASRPPICLH
ncbi:hypothetical protein T261_6362 [Streptomyces lydicus]|nr:hypothetical protein T261_6362 [Streptomyces lydicus]